MAKIDTQNHRILPFLVSLSLLFAGIFFTHLSHANTAKSDLAGTQLAYFVGHHSGGNHNGYHRGGHHGGVHHGGHHAGHHGAVYYGGYRNYGYGGSGYHSGFNTYNPGLVYYGTTQGANLGWTGWKYIGYGCRRSCLINKSNGNVVRCKKRCN